VCGNIFEDCSLLALSSQTNSHPIHCGENLNCPNIFECLYIIHSKPERRKRTDFRKYGFFKQMRYGL